MTKPTIVPNFSKTSRYAFNTLIGALESRFSDSEIEIKIPRSHTEFVEILSHANTQTLALWSFYSTQFRHACEQLEQIKSSIPKATIIHLAGGVHASAEPLQTLRAGFDWVAIGEGEKIIVDAVRSMIAGEALDRVQGIATLKDGQLVRNGRGELIDLDAYPPFATRAHLYGAIEITRGCVYACRFCQTPYISKARFRHRSVQNIATHARAMRAHGFRDYRFISPTALSYGSQDDSVNLPAIEELLSSMREAVGADARLFFGTFPSELRPEHVTPASLRILKKYVDNDNLIIGGQSGSQRMLDLSKRGHSVEAIVDAVRICVDEGFLPNVDFLFGLPGETEDDMQLSISLAEKLTDLGAKIHSHTFMPLPGTPFKNTHSTNATDTLRRKIEHLEATGKAYGNWRQQAISARLLAELRDMEPL